MAHMRASPPAGRARGLERGDNQSSSFRALLAPLLLLLLHAEAVRGGGQPPLQSGPQTVTWYRLPQWIRPNEGSGAAGLLESRAWYPGPECGALDASRGGLYGGPRRHPLYTLTTANNTALILGAVSASVVDGLGMGEMSNATIAPVLVESADGGLSWVCRLVPDGLLRPQAAAFAFDPLLSPPHGRGWAAATGDLSVARGPYGGGGGRCSLLCLAGGLLLPSRGETPQPPAGGGNASTTSEPPAPLPPPQPTDRVSCSSDDGRTWFEAARLPTRVTRATAVQVGPSLLVIGGIRDDRSATVYSAAIDDGACNITGWDAFAATSPVTDRYDLTATTVWDDEGLVPELWVGGGKMTVGGVPQRNIDLWRTTTPSLPATWERVAGLLPLVPILDRQEEAVSVFSDLRDWDGQAWNLNKGACNATAAIGSTESADLCFQVTFLLSGDYAYVNVRGVTEGWISSLRHVAYSEGSTPRVVEDTVPLHRRPIWLADREHAGAPYALVFDTAGWDTWRVDTTPCWDSCPPGTWTTGCTYSPYDAVCQPCSECVDGSTYQALACQKGGGSFGYADTTCRACATCDAPGYEVATRCNTSHNTVCRLALAAPAGRTPDLDPFVRVPPGSLMAVYGAALGFACVTLLAVTAAALASPRPWEVVRAQRRAGRSCAGAAAAALGALLVEASRAWWTVWPVLGTVAHYVCFGALGAALWPAPRLHTVGVAVLASLVWTPLLNAALFARIAMRRVESNGRTVPSWRPQSARDGAAALLGLLHPRAVVSLVCGPSGGGGGVADAAGAGAASWGGSWRGAVMPLARRGDLLLWGLAAALFCDAPPIFSCLLLLGSVSAPSLAPAVVMCVVLGAVNLFASFSWILTAYMRSSMLKLTSSSAANIDDGGDAEGAEAAPSHRAAKSRELDDGLVVVAAAAAAAAVVTGPLTPGHAGGPGLPARASAAVGGGHGGGAAPNPLVVVGRGQAHWDGPSGSVSEVSDDRSSHFAGPGVAGAAGQGGSSSVGVLAALRQTLVAATRTNDADEAELDHASDLLSMLQRVLDAKRGVRQVEDARVSSAAAAAPVSSRDAAGGRGGSPGRPPPRLDAIWGGWGVTHTDEESRVESVLLDLRQADDDAAADADGEGPERLAAAAVVGSPASPPSLLSTGSGSSVADEATTQPRLAVPGGVVTAGGVSRQARVAGLVAAGRPSGDPGGME